jgi:hypothetical protein
VSTIRLGCNRAGNLFYEPEGLLLASSLIPVSSRHGEHLLTFQLGYIGAGEITVHITLEGDIGGLSSPRNTTALLRGTDADDEDGDASYHRIPGVWLTYVTVPEREVAFRYTVSGQAPDEYDEGGLRGELVTDVSGRLPLLTATTRTRVTRKPLSKAVLAQPVMVWNQTDGSGDADECCPCAVRPRAVRAGMT